MKILLGILLCLALLICMAGIGWTSWQTYTMNQRLTNIETNLNALPKPGEFKNQPPNAFNNQNTNLPPPTANGDTNTVKPNAGRVSEINTHAVFLTQSTDPTKFTDATEATFLHGSVPEIAKISNGDIYLYFVDTTSIPTPGSENIAMAKSTDSGKTWTERHTISITGKINKGPAVDPSAIQLANGDMRLYFFGPDAPIGDLTTESSAHNVYSATSSDGINFTLDDGIRFSHEKLTDPDVIRLGDQWIMYYSMGTITGIATSTDGLTFTDTGKTNSLGGVPGAYVDTADTVHLYACGQGGIATDTSTDGVTFSGQTIVALSNGSLMCDPSPVLLDDGLVLMTYKKIVD